MDERQRLKIRIGCLLFIALCTTSLSCGGKDKITGPEKLNKAGFPLAVGNIWNYSAQWTQEEPTGTNISDINITWVVDALEIVSGEKAYRLHMTYRYLSGPYNGELSTEWSWFTQRGDTLWALASEFDDIVPQLSVLFKPVAIFQDDPSEWGINTLVFPLKVGHSWDYLGENHELEGVFELYNKTVTGVDDIQVDAGKFKAFKVTTVASSTGLISKADQWFTSVGLVRLQSETIQDFEAIGASGFLIEKVVMELDDFTLGQE